MSEIAMSIQAEPLPQYNREVMVQVGWLGATGGLYGLHELPTIRQEPGSYTPLYISIGQYNEDGTIDD